MSDPRAWFGKRAAVVLLSLTALASAEKSSLSSAEVLLRLTEASALLHSDPSSFFSYLEPILQRPGDDSLTWEARRQLLSGWVRSGAPDERRTQAVEWWDGLAKSRWNRTEHLAQISRWGGLLRTEKSIPLVGDASRENAPLSVPAGSSGITVPDGSRVVDSGSGWILSQSLSKPHLLYRSLRGKPHEEILLGTPPAWVIAWDDGRLLSAHRSFVQLQRKDQVLFRIESEGADRCQPVRNRFSPWKVPLECPEGETRWVDLATGTVTSENPLPDTAIKRLFVPHGEVVLFRDHLEFRSAPSEKAIWKLPVIDGRDIDYFDHLLYLRSGKERLYVWDLRSRRLVSSKEGVPGTFFRTGSGVGVLTNNGIVLLLRRDGSVRTKFHTGNLAGPYPIEGDDGLLVSLPNDRWIVLNPDFDEALSPSPIRTLLRDSNRSSSVEEYRKLLEQEPGNPHAWHKLEQLTTRNHGPADSSVAYTERSLRNQLRSTIEPNTIEIWRKQWGAKWIVQMPVSLPFRSPVFLATDDLILVDPFDGTVHQFDLKTKVWKNKKIVATEITQISATPQKIYLTSSGGRLIRLEPNGLEIAAEWRGYEEILLLTMGGESPLLLSSSDDSLIIRKFNSDLHSSLLRKWKSETAHPLHFSADEKSWIIGFSSGKLRGGNYSLTAPVDWEVTIPYDIVRLDLAGDTLVVGTSKSKLLFLDSRTGRMIGRLDLQHNNAGGPVSIAHNDKYLFSHFENGVTLLANRRSSPSGIVVSEQEGAAYTEAKPFWWKQSLLFPQPDGLRLILPESFSVKPWVFTPSRPVSCLLYKDEAICALETGWLVSFTLPDFEIIFPAAVHGTTVATLLKNGSYL